MHALRGKVSARLKEFGCGSYGCVLPTLDPKIVLKVTSDETEAEFASKLSQSLVVPIVVNYKLAMSLPIKRQGRRVYLLWRESADDVGELKGKADRLVDRQHNAANDAYKLIADGERGFALENALKVWQERLEAMAKVSELAYVATGMLRIFREQHIGIFDLHAGNLGKVKRGARSEWVIVDPGHVAVIAAR